MAGVEGLEEQKNLVLACAAAGTATHEHVEGFRTQESRASSRADKVGALCVWREYSRDSATTYMSVMRATEVRGSTHSILRLWV